MSWHFLCLATAVLAPPIGSAPPSPLIMGAYGRVTRHHLEFLAQTSPYRFYSPDPATFVRTWLRLLHADGEVRWVEFPRRADYAAHMRLQRRLAIGWTLESGLQHSPGDEANLSISPAGRTIIESMVRHLARKTGSPGKPVTEVQVYLVRHRVRQPHEIRIGWKPTDLRTYLPRYVGTYTADGEPAKPRPGDESAGRRPAIPISLFAATILREDVRPALGAANERDRGGRLRRLGLPDTIGDLIAGHPGLLDPMPGENLQDRIRRAVEDRDDAAFKAQWRSRQMGPADW